MKKTMLAIIAAILLTGMLSSCIVRVRAPHLPQPNHGQSDKK